MSAAAGFETGTLSEVSSSTGTCSVQSTIKRTGDYALQCNPTTTNVGAISITHGDNPTNYMSVYVYIITAPAANSEQLIVQTRANTSYKTELRLNSSRNLEFYDNSLALVATGATVLSLNTWYRIGVKYTTGGSGSYEVQVDGVTELSGTCSQNIAQGGRFYLGKLNDRNGQTIDIIYDDWAWSTTGFPPAGECRRMDVDGDGTYTTWTIGAGSGADYTNVDELPFDSDTSYLLSTLSVGDASTITFESSASAGISGTIFCVAAYVVHKRNAGGASLKTRVRSGSTDVDSAAITPITGYVASVQYLDTDPNTAAAWTTGGLDGLEAGAVENSTSQATRMTAVHCQVYFTPSTFFPAQPKICNQAVKRSNYF